MMINDTILSLSPLNAGEEYYGPYNETVLSNNSHSENDSGLILGEYSLMISYLLISILGLWWNGTVIWVLGFCLKRTPFTTYILNLSMADFGLLTVVLIHRIYFIVVVDAFIFLTNDILLLIFLFMYTSGQFLLTAISVDRCVAVLFPLWHRCHRPPNMSVAVCALIWGLSSISPAINFILLLTDLNIDRILSLQLIMNGLLCLPLMTISTVVLFIKVCFKSHQKKRGKLLIIVLLALFLFIIFSFPVNAIFITLDILHSDPPPFFQHAVLYTCLNSCLNPLIYFLVGRQKKGKFWRNMKAILQNAFKEEENLNELADSCVETQL